MRRNSSPMQSCQGFLWKVQEDANCSPIVRTAAPGRMANNTPQSVGRCAPAESYPGQQTFRDEESARVVVAKLFDQMDVNRSALLSLIQL